MDDRHAAQPGRGQEPGRVAERAAADRDERLAAFDAESGQLAGRVLDDRQALGGLALRQEDGSTVPTGLAQPAAIRSPTAAQAPGSLTRIARRAPERGQLLGQRRGRDPVADDDPPDRRLGAQEHRAGAGPGRRAVVGEPRSIASTTPWTSATPDWWTRRPRRTARAGCRGRGSPRSGRGRRRAAGRVGQRRRRWARTSGRPSSQIAQPAAVERPAVARVDDRAAAGRDDTPDLGRPVGRSEGGDRAPLAGPEPGLALLGEDLRDRPAGRRLDALVEVDEGRAVAVRQPPPDRALAAAGQPDEDDVHRRPQSSPPEPASSVPRQAVSPRRPPATGASGAVAMRAG